MLVRSFQVRRRAFTLTEQVCDTWTMLLVDEGSFRYAIGDNEQGDAHVGDLIVCPPGQVLHRRATAPMLHFFFFEWKPEGGCPPVQPGKHTPRDRPRLLATLHDLSAQPFGQGTESGDYWREHLFRDLLYLCRTEITEVRFAPNPRMEKAAQLLERGAGTVALSIAHVGQQVGLGPVQFSRTWTAWRGETPSATLARLRIGKACQLLRETDDTLDTIAEQCGYQSGFYLSRVFTRHKGVPPSVYRKQFRV